MVGRGIEWHCFREHGANRVGLDFFPGGRIAGAAERSWNVDSQVEVKEWGNYWGIVSTALVGAFAGYLLTTPRGRRFCDAAIQMLEDFSYECARFGQAAARAQVAASEGWKAVEGTFDVSKRPTTH
jgi:hypothetical protein